MSGSESVRHRRRTDANIEKRICGITASQPLKTFYCFNLHLPLSPSPVFLHAFRAPAVRATESQRLAQTGSGACSAGSSRAPDGQRAPEWLVPALPASQDASRTCDARCERQSAPLRFAPHSGHATRHPAELTMCRRPCTAPAGCEGGGTPSTPPSITPSMARSEHGRSSEP